MPIYIYSSSSYTSTAFYIYSITIFSKSFSRVFSKIISWQLFRKEQSFFFTLYKMTIVITLKYLHGSPLQRQVVIVLVNSISTTSTAALIILFRILSSPSALLVGSFYIVFFISFANTIQLISRGKGQDQLLISNRSTQPVSKKNLSTSIFILSLLLFIYQSYSIWQSIDK